jgi:hypothetical protein
MRIAMSHPKTARPATSVVRHAGRNENKENATRKRSVAASTRSMGKNDLSIGANDIPIELG